jgi:UDP-N-acetylmuramate--alanine ligase
MEIDFKKIKKVHFIGVGGIGISAVARMMLEEGKQVSGNDTVQGDVVDELIKLGVVFTLGQKPELVPTDANLIIYSRAIEIADPVFLAQVKALGIPALSYPEALAIISKNKFTIAVSGTHGKTTTTAMIASVLLLCKTDPTVIVGSMLKSHNSNFIAGKGEYLVVEADEYHRAFLNLYPKVLVITNIDKDHLDYYKDLEDIQSAFRELALRVPEDGFIICNPNLLNVAPVLVGVKASVIDYSQVTDVPALPFPGHHNIENAQVALALAQVLKLDTKASVKALTEFKGTARRFELKGESERGVLIYDDYAHNPQKVRAAIAGAREKFPHQKIFAVFQPHLFSRTKLLLEEFAESFADADEVIILPIYAAREVDDGSIDNAKLAGEIKKYQDNVKALSFTEASEYLQEETMAGGVVLTLGAGEAYKVGDSLLGK